MKNNFSDTVCILLLSSSNNNISFNTITTAGIGIMIANSSSTVVFSNIFFKNMTSSRGKILACFINSTTYWDSNYWDRSRIVPKLIFRKNFVHGKTRLWINVDWHPAKEPNINDR